MEESKDEDMIGNKSMRVRDMLKAKRPTYFIQTKEGAYSGMIKHNLLGPTRSSAGSSLSFTDMCM